MCVICGLKTKKLSEKGMCEVCDHLADEKFYEIPNKFMARKYFKDHLRRPATKEERDDLDQLFVERPTTEWIHGIMPSKCPYCKNLAINKGAIQSYRLGSDKHKKVVIDGIMPSLVCKACGDFSLYLNHVFKFSTIDATKTLRFVCDLKDENKKIEKLVCETCAKECGFKERKYTDEQKEIIKKTDRKILCDECLSRLKKHGETAKLKVQTNK